MSEQNYDEVILPNCVHEFRAIPVNVQSEIDWLRAEKESLEIQKGAFVDYQRVLKAHLKTARELIWDDLEMSRQGSSKEKVMRTFLKETEEL